MKLKNYKNLNYLFLAAMLMYLIISDDAYGLNNTAPSSSSTLNYSYKYNNIDQLTEITQNSEKETPSETLKYDENGNLISIRKDKSDNLQGFNYNELNQLVSYNTSNGSNTLYDYDAQGLRSDKYHNKSDRISYYYDPNDSVINEAQNNSITAYLATGTRILRAVNDTASFYISNGKDVSGITDQDANITSSYAYESYGKNVDLNNPKSPIPHSLFQNPDFSLAENPFLYSSYYQDAESGMYYLKARFYSPYLMQFISKDTYDLSNKYAYGDGNPVSNTDLNGHMPQSWEGTVPIFIGLITGIGGELVGGLSGQVILAVLDIAGYAIKDEAVNKNNEEFLTDLKRLGIGEGFGSLPFLYRAVRSSSRGNIAFGYLGRRYERKELGKAFTEAGIKKWEGKKVLSKNDVETIFRAARNNGYTSVCHHEAVLWGLSEKGISKPVSHNEVTEIMRKGFKWGNLRGVCDAVAPKSYYKQYFKDIRDLTPQKKETKINEFLSTAPTGKYLMLSSGHIAFMSKDEQKNILESVWNFNPNNTWLEEVDLAKESSYMTEALYLGK